MFTLYYTKEHANLQLELLLRLEVNSTDAVRLCGDAHDDAQDDAQNVRVDLLKVLVPWLNWSLR